MSVPDALGLATRVATVFNRHRTACVGCPLARFCDLRAVAHTYGLDLDALLRELEQAADFSANHSLGGINEKID